MVYATKHMLSCRIGSTYVYRGVVKGVCVVFYLGGRRGEQLRI